MQELRTKSREVKTSNRKLKWTWSSRVKDSQCADGKFRRLRVLGTILQPQGEGPGKDQHLGQGEDKSHRCDQHCEKNGMVLGMAHQPPGKRPMDLACHHLETIWDEKTTRETCQAVERRPGQILERHCDCLAADRAQYRLTWRRRAEAFAQPRDTTAA